MQHILPRYIVIKKFPCIIWHHCHYWLASMRWYAFLFYHSSQLLSNYRFFWHKQRLTHCSSLQSSRERSQLVDKYVILSKVSSDLVVSAFDQQWKRSHSKRGMEHMLWWHLHGSGGIFKFKISNHNNWISRNNNTTTNNNRFRTTCPIPLPYRTRQASVWGCTEILQSQRIRLAGQFLVNISKYYDPELWWNDLTSG